MKHLNVLILALAFGPGLVSAGRWTGPFQLTTDSGSDIHPALSRDYGNCLVWQTNRNGNWDVYSRFDTSVNAWGPEIPVTRGPGNNFNPVIAGGSCCVWEREEDSLTSSIRAAFYNGQGQWADSAQIGLSRHAAGDWAEPSVTMVEGDAVRAVWAVWLSDDSLGHAVYYSVNTLEGAGWSQPAVAVRDSAVLRHARIGCGLDTLGGVLYPLLVWERAGHIFGSTRVGDYWTLPFEVAHSSAWDANPEVISYSIWDGSGPWIVWQSNRDGDTAIFGTSLDSVGSARRWCDSGSVGANVNPVGTPLVFLATDGWELCAEAWVSDRNGNPDIYSSINWDGDDVLVDNNPALDSNPALAWDQGQLLRCCWQSNRSGNWDIFYSYIYNTGVEETKPATDLNRPAVPGIVRGVLELPQASSRQPRATSWLLDAAGRRVAELHPGRNDVSRFGGGVYFVREVVSGKPSGVCRKLVILK